MDNNPIGLNDVRGLKSGSGKNQYDDKEVSKEEYDKNKGKKFDDGSFYDKSEGSGKYYKRTPKKPSEQKKEKTETPTPSLIPKKQAKAVESKKEGGVSWDWNEALHAIPIVGTVKMSSEAWDRGEYAESMTIYGFAFVELFTMGTATAAKTGVVAVEQVVVKQELKTIIGTTTSNEVVKAVSKQTITVLGSYNKVTGGYLALAKKMNANYFEIAAEVWAKMTGPERWLANVKFLDKAIARGDVFILSNSAKEAKAGTYFYKELQYLYSKNYKVAKDGMSLFK